MINLIFGASGYASEVDWLSHNITQNGLGRYLTDYFVAEDGSSTIGSTVNSKLVISESEAFTRFSDTPVNCFIAVGVPAIKKIIVQSIISKLHVVSFPNLISPTVSYDGRQGQIDFGKGIILYHNVTVSCNVSMGDFVTVNNNGVVGHDVTIGNYCQIGPGVCVCGWVTLRDEVIIGANASILPHATVEDAAVVGAGSVVLRRVPARQTVFGVPAKPVPLPVLPSK